MLKLEKTASTLDVEDLGLCGLSPRQSPLSGSAMLGRVAAAIRKRELRMGILSLVDQAIVSGTSFATSVVIGRLCGKSELGVFYLALTIVYVAKGIQEQLVSAPYVVYCHHRNDAAQARYTGSAILHQFGLSLVAMVLLLGMLVLLMAGVGPISLVPTLWWLLGSLPLLLLRELIRRLSMAHLHMTTAIAVDTVVAVLQIGGLITLGYFQRLTVPNAYGVMGAACAAACSVWLFAQRRPLQFAWSDTIDDWRHNWLFARWALPCHLIGYGTLYLTPWIVTAVLGSGEAGVLAACVSLIGIASMFVTGLAAFLAPRAAMAYAKGGVPALRRVLREGTLTFACVLGIFALTVLFCGGSLLEFIYGNRYVGQGAVTGTLAASMAVESVGLMAGIGLAAIHRPDANFPADVCAFVVSLLLIFGLLPFMGILGAAVGCLAGKVVSTLIRYRMLQRLLNPLAVTTGTGEIR
jgi:O-antigen/teichoic acid export membrane protein